jgi:hypothetical protein
VKITHAVDDRVRRVDKKLPGIPRNVGDVGHRRAHVIDGKVEEYHDDVQDPNSDRKIVYRSSSPSPCSPSQFRKLRNPPQKASSKMTSEHG